MRMVDHRGHILLEHSVERGDIWRMCQTKDVAIRDWVKLAVSRASSTGHPAVFWLDPQRAHDANLIRPVERYLQDHDIDGPDISIMAPKQAIRHTLQRVWEGKDTISVTGNVLRDYLTDLFPILELGTSAKMLSIVPLLAGGGLYETGAGGSAPRHVQQLIRENHFALGFPRGVPGLCGFPGGLGRQTQDGKIRDLALALDRANGQYLERDKSPSRKVGELDTRGSHFYLALYWARQLAEGANDSDLKQRFGALYQQLRDGEVGIVSQLQQVQGRPVDLGGYYRPDLQKVARVMRPSDLLNRIISAF